MAVFMFNFEKCNIHTSAKCGNFTPSNDKKTDHVEALLFMKAFYHAREFAPCSNCSINISMNLFIFFASNRLFVRNTIYESIVIWKLAHLFRKIVYPIDLLQYSWRRLVAVMFWWKYDGCHLRNSWLFLGRGIIYAWNCMSSVELRENGVWR